MVTNNFSLIGTALTDLKLMSEKRAIYAMRMEVENHNFKNISYLDIFFYKRFNRIIENRTILGCTILVTGFMSSKFEEDLNRYLPVLIGTQLEIIEGSDHYQDAPTPIAKLPRRGNNSGNKK